MSSPPAIVTLEGFDTKVQYQCVEGMEVVSWDPRKVIKPRRVHCVEKLTGDIRFGVHNSSLTNLGRALHERVFRVKGEAGLEAPPKPLVGVFRERCEWFKDELLSKVSYLPRHSRQQVVECYTGQKRSLYQRAADSLLTVPLSTADARIKAFVKAEKINLTSKDDPAPRLIQPRSVRYNVELGRYLRINEKRILKLIDTVAGEPTVMKGYNVLQAGRILAEKWGKFVDPVGVGLDASRWDQHCSVEALRFEHSIYKGLFPNDHYLSWLLDMQLVNHGIGLAKDGGIRYVVNGCRMSGDVNTSLGNCLLMCGLVLSYCRQVGVRASLINNGDDCVVLMEREDYSRFSLHLSQWFLECGYNLVVEPPVDVLEQVEFCQSQPVCVDGEWRMVRQPKTSVSKDSYTIVSLQTTGDCESWCKAVGDCGLTLTAGVPCLQDLYLNYKVAGKDRNPSRRFRNLVIEWGNVERMRGLATQSKLLPIAASTRVSYYKAFGISPNLQVACEKALTRMRGFDLMSSPGETIHREPNSAVFNEWLDGMQACLPKPNLHVN